MAPDEFFGVIAAITLLGFLIYLPVRFFMLIGQVKRLEQEVSLLANRQPPVPVRASSEPAAVPAAPAALSTPPPLPVRPAQAASRPKPVVAEPDPLFLRLRDLGLLPPSDLKGEYALGAWWAVRVGGLLAVAAVVFLGIWLNLRSTIPPAVRVLEVALVGAGLFWGGLRLAAKRKDLGEVLAAAGLGVWQFAAWATYGLDKMRVCDTPAQAAVAQFAVALVVAGLALWKGSKLFGQLAVAFAAFAVYLSIGTGAAPWPTAIGAGLVALVGVILMVRGPWGSAGILGLVGSQACLLFLYDAMPTKGADYLPLQLVALASFLVLWIGERLLQDDDVLRGVDARVAFQLVSFFAPACLALFLANGGDNDRATVSLLIAAVAAIVGYVEQRRSRLVSEVLLLAAVGFVGAGLAWLVDPHLVSLIWALAAAATLVVGTRTRSELVRWSAEALAGVAAFAFLAHPPSKPWVALAGIAAFGLMLALREDWERPSGFQQFRRVVGILCLAFAALSVQDQLPRADSGWPWVVLLLVAAVRFRPALLWAAAPAYLLTTIIVVFWRPLTGAGASGWAAGWAAWVLAINACALWRLRERRGSANAVLRHLLAFATAVVAYALSMHLAVLVLAPLTEGSPRIAARLALAWSLGAGLLVSWGAFWRRCGANPQDLALSACGALVGFVIQGVVATGAGITKLGLPHSPFILLGLAGLLHVLAVHTKEQGGWGAVHRAVLGAVTLLIAYVMLAFLPGAGVSLFWALAAMMMFVLGHLLATRSFRMIGLVGLGVATIRVLSHDITDLLGRVAACAAVAVAFFAIAWLYGRITADKRDA